jgi:recombination protein RecA
MTPLEDLEGKIESTGRIGLQAQLMSRMLSRLTKKISRGRKPALVIVNQTRMKIDTKNARNNGEQSAAGSAIKFYASVRLQLENLSGEGDTERGKGITDQVYTQNRVRITAIKNKVAPPWMRGQFTIEFGKGINNILSIAELAEQRLQIMSGAGFFNYKGDSPETSFTCRGRENFQQLLHVNQALLAELETKVLNSMQEEQSRELGILVSSSTEAAKEIEAQDVLVLGGGAKVPSGDFKVEDV